MEAQQALEGSVEVLQDTSGAGDEADKEQEGGLSAEDHDRTAAEGDGSAEEEEEKEDEEKDEEDGNNASAAASGEDGWLYVDDGGEERGPYTLQEMLTWYNCQLLRADLPVRRQSESEYAALSTRPEFNPYYAYYAHYYAHYSTPAAAAGAPAPDGTSSSTTATATTGAAAYDGTSASSAYALGSGAAPQAVPQQANDPDKELAARLMAEASYTQVGSFNARTGRFQAQKRGWDDPAGRQIAHYFDEQAWQQQAQAQKPKKIKLTKKEIQKFKEKKKKKKIPAYLLDD